MNPVMSLRCLKMWSEKIFQHMPSYNQHFLVIKMPQQLKNCQRVQYCSCEIAAFPKARLIREKEQNRQEQQR